MTLVDAIEGEEYKIKNIDTQDDELKSFLFTLGCYEGESIQGSISLKGGCTISVKDGRYNIDKGLAKIIYI